jgi:hypothetical protein
MPELLEDIPVKLGNVILVKNIEKTKRDEKTDRQINEPAVYVSIQVEDYNGKHERCILLTEHEYKSLPEVKLPTEFTAKLLVGRLYPVNIGKTDAYFLAINSAEGWSRLVRVGAWLLTKADARAAKHPESVTKKNWFRDLVD